MISTMALRSRFTYIVSTLALAFASLILHADVSHAHHTTIRRASLPQTSPEGNDDSAAAAISADGRYVVFLSDSSNLVAGDSNGFRDVFIRDLVEGATELVSSGVSDQPANSFSESAAVSADGRYVAFYSFASNLVGADTTGWDVFVRDRNSGTTEMVSVSSAEVKANADSYDSAISMTPDGRYVAFTSGASNLVSGDTNGQPDVFVRDRTAGTTTRVSVSSSGGQASAPVGLGSQWPSLSSDGRYVAFSSGATNLVNLDTNTAADIFIRDRTANQTERVSVTSQELEALSDSARPVVSGDGRYVAFQSQASNLVVGDTNSNWDIFLRDRTGGTTTRVSVNSSNQQGNGWSQNATISSSGGLIVFASAASSLVSGDTNAVADIFMRETASSTTRRLSVSASGSQGNAASGGPAPVDANGRYAAFTSDASNLVSGDGNAASDVFLVDRGETIAPAIAGLVATPSTISPNGDSQKDSSTITATITDESPPLSWTMSIKNSLGLTIRTYSGEGNSASQVWDGRDSQGALVPDGAYSVTLTTTDDWGNVAGQSIGVTVDTVPPTVSNWNPLGGSNTLWRRPTFAATISDDRSGVDAASPQVRLNGVLIPSDFNASSGTMSAVANSDLALDVSHTVALQVADQAGNLASPLSGFRVIDVRQENLQASIPEVITTVPPAGQCLANCTVTFRGVSLQTGAHDVEVSSSSHAGTGTFRRSVGLATAYVEWHNTLGNTFTTTAGLTSTTHDDGLWLDEGYSRPFVLPFGDSERLLGDVTVPVPLNAARNSTAALRMGSVSVPPACSSTFAATNPATCGGPASSGIDPLGGPEPTSLEISESQIDAALAQPIVQALDGLTEDFEVAAPRPPSGDTSWSVFDSGVIQILVRPGEDITEVVADHGDSPSGLEPVFLEPFDDIAISNGLDRYFHVSVPGGLEKARVAAYAADSRVEYVQLVDDKSSGVELVNPSDPFATSTEQYNLFSETGIFIKNAWDFANFYWTGVPFPPGRPLDSFRGTRSVELAVVDTGIRGTHEDLGTKVVGGYNMATGAQYGPGANSETGCYGAHGTGVAGMNAATNNDRGLAGVNWHGRLYSVVRYNAACALAGSRAGWIDRARAAATEVINVSYGYPTYNDAECAAIKNAYDRDIITVTAYRQQAGPSGNFPGRCGYTITTSATGKDGGIAPFTRGYIDEHVNLFAPGEHVTSTSGLTNSTYHRRSLDGTSYASPTVAGLTQLMWGMGVPPRSIGAILVYSGFPSFTCGAAPCGKVNAHRAMKSALANGVFEVWASSSLPDRWTRSRSCGSATLVAATSQNVTPSGSTGMATGCTGGGYFNVYQSHPVTNGWIYNFSAAAKTNVGGVANWMEAFICFFNASGAQVGSCSKANGGSEGTSTAWHTWEQSACAPAGAVTATVILRTLSSSATNYWDDARFYARKPCN